MKITILLFCVSLFVSTLANSEENLGYQGKNNDGLSPQELLEKLKTDGETNIRQERGWVVASSEKLRTIWSFPPKNHPAYPSYVKREVVEKDGALYIETGVRCGAEKIECDKLVKDFIELNNNVQRAVQ